MKNIKPVDKYLSENTCVIELQYVLKKSGKFFAFNHGNENYFGHIFILSPNVQGDLFIHESVMRPWELDTLFTKYKDSVEYKPVLSKINILNVNGDKINNESQKIVLDTIRFDGYSLISIKAGNSKNSFEKTANDSVYTKNLGLSVFTNNVNSWTNIQQAFHEIENTMFANQIFDIKNTKNLTGYFILNKEYTKGNAKVYGIIFQDKVYPVLNQKPRKFIVNRDLQEPHKTDTVFFNDSCKINRFRVNNKFGYLAGKNVLFEAIFDKAQPFSNNKRTTTAEWNGEIFVLTKRGKKKILK